MTREQIWNKAYKRIFELYGENPDLNIVNRFFSEKAALAHFGVAEYFEEIAHILEESVTKYNEKLVAKASVTSCLLAYLLGASEINPLPPHWICPKCHSLMWADRSDCIFDMPSTRTCECGAEMRPDGYGLAWELYLPLAQKLNEKKDEISANNYHDLFEAILDKHFQKNLLPATQACNLLRQATGVAWEDIPFDDPQVKAKLLSGDFTDIPFKIVRSLCLIHRFLRPTDYTEMLQLISLGHGTYTFRENAQNLIENGICTLKNIPASTDEVFATIENALRKLNISDNGFAFHVTERVHHGYYRKHGGMDENTAKMLKQLEFKDWFVDYLSRIHYMAPRALSILELRILLILTWYHTYYPMEYTNLTKEIPDISKQIKII